MPRIHAQFKGVVRGAEINEAYSPSGELVSVSGMTREEFISKLSSSELRLSLRDCMDNCDMLEAELDFSLNIDNESENAK